MVKNAVEDILKLDIDDPTDFSYSPLQSLDSSLRCLICSNLFEGPVVLPCGHSFCSLVRVPVLPASLGSCMYQLLEPVLDCRSVYVAR